MRPNYLSMLPLRMVVLFNRGSRFFYFKVANKYIIVFLFNFVCVCVHVYVRGGGGGRGEGGPEERDWKVHFSAF